MKVQQIQQNNYNNQRPQFKSLAGVLRFLAVNQGVGANLTDLSFMVLPRTLSDAQRGPAACLETARREASGTANHSLIGAYGLASGAVIGSLYGLNKKFNTKTNTIFAAPETINILAENKASQIKNNLTQLEYLKETLSNLKAYNPTLTNADSKGFVKISQTTVDEAAQILNKAISTLDYKAWETSGTFDSIEAVVNTITRDTGAQSKYILESSQKAADGKALITSETSLKTFLEDLFKVSKSFNEEAVQKAFKDQIANGKGINENAFIKQLNKFMKTRALAGFAIATGIGMSIQPLNIYLTKLKTGSDGFVGVEGRSKDNSAGFWALKGATATAFGAGVLATLGTGLKGFMSKMAFKGFWPTLSQLKGIYGLTIMSRFMAARDKDELREAATKDTLGFLSWLVLGDIVNKATAAIFDDKDNTVLNSTEKEVKGVWNNVKRVFNAQLKTRDEVLIETLKANDTPVVKKVGNSTVAKTFGEMMKDINTLPEKAKNIAKRKIRVLNGAQLVGYAFSGLVLGFGIPNLNIYITNKLEAKRKAKAQTEFKTQKA